MFQDCIDAETNKPLYYSTDMHKRFTNALDTNINIIRFIIKHHDTKIVNLSETPKYNYRRRKLLVLAYAEREKSESLKQTIQKIITDPTRLPLNTEMKLFPYYRNKFISKEDLYNFFKVLAMCQDQDYEEGFKILSYYLSSQNLCTQRAAEILAKSLFCNLHFDELSQKNTDDEVTNAYHEFINTRNRIILLLLRKSNIRDIFAPIVNSCVRQLLKLPDEITLSKPIRITYAELCRRIDKALHPQDYSFHKKQPNYFSGEYDYRKLSYLKDERVQKELQAKYGMSNIEVLEEIICRDLTRPANEAPLELAEVISNAQKTYEEFFERITIEPTPAVSMAVAAAAPSASSTMQYSGLSR